MRSHTVDLPTQVKDHFNLAVTWKGTNLCKHIHVLFCDKAFKQKCHLESDTKTHTGENSFSCDVCHKLPAYITHNNIYIGAQCQETFAQKHILDSHMGIDTGERAPSRDACQKSFSWKSSFKGITRGLNG